MISLLGVDQTYSTKVSGIGRFNKSVPSTVAPPPALTVGSPSVGLLRQQLMDSLRLRVLNIPKPPSLYAEAEGAEASDTRVAVLFSGGLDCTVLARLTHELLDPDQGIDLINVAFENPRVVAQLQKDARARGDSGPVDFYEACPDRVTGRKSFAELRRACPGRAFRFLAVCYQPPNSHPH